MTSASTIRAAGPADVPAIRALLAAHGNDATVDTIGTVDIVGPYLRHCLEHAKAAVTERDGQVVAYGAAIETGRGRHLADLFVRPDLLGQGLGRSLLEAVMKGATARTTFASDDPRALPIYARAGMTPLWLNLYVEGEAPGLPAGRAPTVEPAAPDDLAALEFAWTGACRPADHRYWAALPEADEFVVRSAGGNPIALGYARARQVSSVRWIDRLVVRPDADPVSPILAALGYADRGRGGTVGACLPGPNPALVPLLEARFRITDRDVYMASSPDLVDSARLLPDGGML